MTLSDEIEQNLEAYIRQQDAAPPLTAVVQAALTEYLARRGFSPQPRKLVITPAKRGSGARNVSVEHDRYLAGR